VLRQPHSSMQLLLEHTQGKGIRVGEEECSDVLNLSTMNDVL